MSDKPKRFKLSHLLLDEISFVDRGANPGARVLLYKAASRAAKGGVTEGESDMSFDDLLKKHLAGLGVADDQIDDAVSEIVGEIEKAAGDDLQAKIDEAVAKAKTEAEDAAKAEFDEKVEAEVAKRMEEISKSEDDKLKDAMPEDVRKRFEAMEAERAKDAERIAKMEAERAETELRKRAEALPNIGDKDVVVALTKGLTEDGQNAFFDFLKGVNDQLAKADRVLTQTHGTTEPSPDSAEAQMNKKAEVLAKAENITHQQAFHRVAKKHPELMAQYRAEQDAQ